MKSVYVDTAALIALGHEKDDYHQKALQVFRALLKEKTTLITTNAVLLEFGNAFSAPAFRPVFIRIKTMIQTSRFWQYKVVNDSQMNAAETLFESHLDKSWSLVDCLSMNIADKYQIKDIFTSDRHFEQAGFNILLSKQR